MPDDYVPLELRSALPVQQVVQRLRAGIDAPPSWLRSLLTFNAHYFAGTSAVCGEVKGTRLELRNRRGPGLSLVARGELYDDPDGTVLRLVFSRPRVPDLLRALTHGYDADRKLILDFLRAALRVTYEGAAPGAGVGAAVQNGLASTR